MMDSLHCHTEFGNTIAEFPISITGTTDAPITNVTRNRDDEEKELETMNNDEPMTKDADDDEKQCEILKHNL